LGGLTGPERAAEHYRRLAVARKRFARRGMFGAPPTNALRLGSINTAFDDRGVVYIRHGDPAHTIGVPPLQAVSSWFYTDESGEPLSFHFAKMSGDRDYRLMYNLPCNLDVMAAAYDPRLTEIARGRCDPIRNRSVSARINRDVELALETDSHTLHFEDAIPFHYDWYTFRAETGTELLMAVGVPLHQLPRGEHSLRVRLSLVNKPDYSAVQTEQVTEPLEYNPEKGLIARTHLSLTLPPIMAKYRIDVRDASNPRIGRIYGGDVKLPDYRGDTLMVSDVMLTEQADTGAVDRGGAHLALAPTQVFAGGEFRAYYEIYNVPPSARYTTEVVIEPLNRGGIGGMLRRLFGDDDGVQLRFEEFAPEEG